jgi:hypothetical protein
MPGSLPMQLTLEIERATDPISGRVLDEAGGAREFVGWIGLASALEEALGEPPSGLREQRA